MRNEEEMIRKDKKVAQEISPLQELTNVAEIIPVRSSRTQGSEHIIKSMSDSFNKISAHTVEMIESLVTRLENLRERVRLEEKTAIDRMTKFVDLANSSLIHVESLNALAQEIEDHINENNNLSKTGSINKD